MGNTFAYIALAAWPIVAVFLFAYLPTKRALIGTILGAYLLLPVLTEIKISGVPAFDKSNIAVIAGLVGCLLTYRRGVRFWKGFGIPEILILMMLLGPAITASQNGDPLFFGSRMIVGETAYDALSAIVGQFLFLLSFFLGRAVLSDPADTKLLFRALVIAGLIYSLPMLFEVRMSPQLHTWIYGYFPHSFAQQYRDDGFRPVVFLGHGLLVAQFAMVTLLAAVCLWKTDSRIGPLPPLGIVAYLSVVLVLCKSLGSLVYGVVCAPLIRFAAPRTQVRVAVVLTCIALAYPMLRSADLVPVDSMLNMAKSVSEDRAASLQTRFDQEWALLQRASQRFYFGWGRWGRSRVYDETGRDVTLSDGHWVITLGVFGLFGFIAEFGLLSLAVFRAAGALKYVESREQAELLGAMSLIVAVNIVDLLPNAAISPWIWLLVGSLLGVSESIRKRAAQRGVQPSRSVAVRRVAGV